MNKNHIELIDFWLLALRRKTDNLIDDVSQFKEYAVDCDAEANAVKIADAESVWTLLNEVWIILDKYSTIPCAKETK